MPAEIKGLNEECGVFGVWGDNCAAELTHLGLHTLQHRGQEGAGIVGLTPAGLRRHYGLGLVSEVFRDPQSVTQLQGTAALGHVRYSTAGGRILENIQPLLFRFTTEAIALAHNGNLTNALSLRKKLEAAGAIFQSTSDSEVLMHLIRLSQQPTFELQLIEALNQVHGGFAFELLTQSALYAAVDPNGFRPLVIGRLSSGGYVVCSETAALNAVGAEFVQDVQPGQLVIIDDSGMRVRAYTTHTQLAVCSMEYVYFARPDSEIYGISVHEARVRMGMRLAHEQPVDADIVVGVPNSSLSAALGYSRASGIPYEMGLIKSQYVARTFIQPTQELRERSVRLKLSPVRSVIKGKRVVLVDDSIVRGTTARQLVQLFKDAGALEVHLRIASPPLRFPCFYGIDIQTTRELMAANHSVAEMRDIFGVNSLAFLSTQGLIDSVGLSDTAPNGGLCVAYFTGEYPTPLEDYAPALKQELSQLQLHVSEVSA
ncbi:amidophosphoribosyltransferase [Lacticaseibacillus pabuli]|uniref:Amidophosphoribosyltransferase n=1 Tax=Lacticaseibacillus pabuli TaxID=3025672 RepID=A0ABY7WQ72_9LACO|nr:amidophosphoribosyltransferase [Lacticaseibacillus sp. KACC 23028]WDF82333.1 amidophosphoribosyltransferase [Lacticaseibacillus sp. KACC 23028]